MKSWKFQPGLPVHARNGRVIRREALCTETSLRRGETVLVRPMGWSDTSPPHALADAATRISVGRDLCDKGVGSVLGATKLRLECILGREIGRGGFAGQIHVAGGVHR